MSEQKYLVASYLYTEFALGLVKVQIIACQLRGKFRHEDEFYYHVRDEKGHCDWVAEEYLSKMQKMIG